MKFNFRSCVVQFFIAILAANLICTNIVFADDNSFHEKNIVNFKNDMNGLAAQLQKKYSIPGASIGVIQNGKLVYVLNYGMADKKINKPINNQTIFQVASISKSMTAWGVMKLVEEGKIGLDDPVEKYLTRWHFPVSKFNSRDVTIRMLLSHTAGVSVEGYLGTDPRKKLPTLEESLSKGVRIQSKPGSKYEYSGGGYTILQLLIEEVTKKTFNRYMQEEILNPLEMKNSFFDNNVNNNNMAKGYGVFGQELPNYNYTEEAAAGLKTSVEDFSKFLIANMKENNEVLTKQNIDTMFAPVKSNYGLGFMYQRLSDNTEMIYHGGSNRGWRLQYAMIPEKKDGLIVFTNSDRGMDFILDIYDLWEKYETGMWQQGYFSHQRMRNIIILVQIISVLLVLFYVIYLTIRIKMKKTIFFIHKENISIIKLILRLIVPTIIVLLWLIVVYVLRVITVLPYEIEKITFSVIILATLSLVAGLFVKNN